jgi:hypothetical protein
MAESYVQVATDGTGKRLRTSERTIEGNLVHAQFVILAGMPTYYFQTASSAAAISKIYFDLFNASGSGVVLKVRKLFIQQHWAVMSPGIIINWAIDKTSTVGTGGTVLTGRATDSADPALPAQVTARGIPTGGATVVHNWCTIPLSSEETDIGSRPAWMTNALPEGNETQDVTLREGEGIKVTQTAATSSSAGTWSVFCVVTTA